MSLPTISKMHKRVRGEEAIAKPIAQKWPTNTGWDDTRHIYVTAMQGAITAEGQLGQVLQDIQDNPHKLALIPDQRALAQSITVLTRDLQSHIDALNGIYEQHQHFSGTTQVTYEEDGQPNVSDHMRMLDLQMQYAEVMKIYEANIVPVFLQVMEQIGATEALLHAQQLSAQEQKLREAQDPSVITDVEVKQPN